MKRVRRKRTTRKAHQIIQKQVKLPSRLTSDTVIQMQKVKPTNKGRERGRERDILRNRLAELHGGAFSLSLSLSLFLSLAPGKDGVQEERARHQGYISRLACQSWKIMSPLDLDSVCVGRVIAS